MDPVLFVDPIEAKESIVTRDLRQFNLKAIFRLFVTLVIDFTSTDLRVNRET